jgi:hypothetical protein
VVDLVDLVGCLGLDLFGVWLVGYPRARINQSINSSIDVTNQSVLANNAVRV